MARRLAALLLLLALGCLLGILLLLLGSGDTRDPPGFKVRGAARGHQERSGGGHREVQGCQGLGEPPWAPRCVAFPVCGLPVRERRWHQRSSSVTVGAGADGSLLCGEGRREQPPPGAQGRGCPSSETRCVAPPLRDPSAAAPSAAHPLCLRTCVLGGESVGHTER